MINVLILADTYCGYQVMVDVMDKDDGDEWFPFAIVIPIL
jgi:hypothetical protein